MNLVYEKKEGKYLQYSSAQLDALKKKDKKLAAIIDRFGYLEREVNPDVFSALIGSIISQQISSKAAQTVTGRLNVLCEGISPEKLFAAEATDIQKCGMSIRKAGYIKAVAQAVCEGTLEIASLKDMADEDVIKLLSSLPGIGVWTAEMLLIFSLERMDVLSYGDLAIRRGICKLYGHKEVTKEQFARYKKRYSPYGSIASLYLWHLSVE